MLVLGYAVYSDEVRVSGSDLPNPIALIRLESKNDSGLPNLVFILKNPLNMYNLLI